MFLILIADITCRPPLISYFAVEKMILGYKSVKGYHVDEEKACRFGEVDASPEERMKSVVVTSRMVDRDDYVTSAVEYRVDDPQQMQSFIFVLDFGDDLGELVKKELDITGKESLMKAAEHVLSGPFVYVYVN